MSCRMEEAVKSGFPSGKETAQKIDAASLDCLLYTSGLFDAPGVADAVLRAVCLRQGIDPEGLGAFDMTQYRQQQYDLLARTVRQGLDMERIYRILKREE